MSDKACFFPRRLGRLNLLLLTAALVFASVVVSAQRRDVFVQSRLHRAIAYDSAPVDNPASRLNAKLRAGTVKLEFDPANGYLRSLLAALDVPVESQGLVFSQTSFQGDLINVRNPRAVYFNDTVAVGWVRGADVLEIAAQDARQGVIFYDLPQKAAAAPQLRRNDECLACHLSWETLGVPGLMVQSVRPLPDDISYVVGFTNNHASPFSERWGGWYVTGTHGRLGHMGNIPVMPEDKGKLKLSDPRELASVQGLFDLKGYPTAHSDVVALMVLAHQTHMTNLITRVGWEARLAASTGTADAKARVQEGARDLVDYLLFVDEPVLTRPVKGSTTFATAFSTRGPRDAKGRGLHDLDLQRRLLRYPCSYMIYSEAFEALPALAKDAIYSRMWEVLSGKETRPRYARLTKADRDAVVQILRETKKDLPAVFKG
jgi:hypothetical protein